MADLIVKEPVRTRQWNGVLMNSFANTLGVSLEELGKEYDDMMKNFELQVIIVTYYLKYNCVLVNVGDRIHVTFLLDCNKL